MDRLISIAELGQLKAVSVDMIVGRRRDEARGLCRAKKGYTSYTSM